MDRLACIDLPAFPLQLLLLKKPEFRDHAVVVVDEDKPLGKILWLNERARQKRILPGMRYAAALSLAPDLRAGVVHEEEIESGLEHILWHLHAFSPDIEQDVQNAGVFFANASGLEALYPSLLRWAKSIRASLTEVGFASSVVVGFRRFGTYSVGRSRFGVGVFMDHEDEERTSHKTSLERLDVHHRHREALSALGIHTLGQMLGLPPGGFQRRFGKELYRLYLLGKGEVEEPIRPTRPRAPLEQAVLLDFAVSNVERMAFLIKPKLEILLKSLVVRGESLKNLEVMLQLEKFQGTDEKLREEIVPAVATLDLRQVMNLVHLRLGKLELSRGVSEIHLCAEGERAKAEQTQLFSQVLLGHRKRNRDLRAAERALARVRAKFGDETVMRARIRDGHLPEAQFVWEPFGRLQDPVCEPQKEKPLVRRFHARPQMLPMRPSREPDGWLVRGFERGPASRVLGPYLVRGGWWEREVSRDYYFVETQKGEISWIYYCGRRQRWFLQGEV